MYWIPVATAAFAVGAIIGYVKGHKAGESEGVERAREHQRNKDQRRGQKAAATRRYNKALPVKVDP